MIKILIIILIIGMALSEMIIEITTKKLMKIFNLKTLLEFNDLIISNRDSIQNKKFMETINLNHFNKINYTLLTISNTFYLIMIIMTFFTSIWYVGILLIITMSIKNIWKFLIEYDSLISILIIALGLLVLLK